MPRDVFILAAKRTPIGKFMGGYSRTSAVTLGQCAIEGALVGVGGAESVGERVDECIMGCVLQAGLGQNPARQAGLRAGLPETLSAQTVNKVCGSGLHAAMLGAQAIKAEDADLIVSGGMENMTLAPHMAMIRGGGALGVKFGPATFEDHMQHDGLRCAFECWPMGAAADHIAETYGVSREEQDRFAAQSHRRAAAAQESGWFDTEIRPLTGAEVGNKKAPGPEGGVAADEGIRADSSPEVLAKLRPAFGETGTVTAGNASQISDGAAAVVLGSAAAAERLGVTPLARVVSYHTSGVKPKDIFSAPISGVRGAIEKAGIELSEIDLVELNEAFAAQVLCNIGTAKGGLGLSEDRVNVCGGGVALGHPIGASGARVLTTLVHQMKRIGAKTGLAALCLGGGNSVAMVVEGVA